MKLITKHALLLMAASLFFAGCGEENIEKVEVDKIQIVYGDNQADSTGAVLKKKIQVQLLGPSRTGLLGGKQKPLPAHHEDVIFEPVKSEKTGLKVLTPARVTTDKGGMATAEIQLGNMFGDQYLKVYPVAKPDKSVTFRFMSGIKIGGKKQEVTSGSHLDEPITITLAENGKPLAGVPVYFNIADKPGKKGKLSKTATVTDADGMAYTMLTTDSKATGVYKINAEVAGEKHYTLRGITIKEMAYSKFALFISVFGGLAIFIFGMKLMSDGLQQVAGNRLKTILGYFARNRFVAVLTGTLVTGFIQSSSACSVMVIGFVNAGLLNLQQAIGVIFGANIGTTITAQMISFKLNNFAMPAIIIGVVIFMMAKKHSWKGVSLIILGFGLLFFGMTQMGAQLKGLKSFPSFAEFFQSFDCTPIAGGSMPLGAILGALAIGTIVTVTVQSSSASMGLVLALAGSGLINFYTAVPLLLGTNIGTTITAILAALGANRPSKQVALAHTIFNVLGSLIMVPLFYVTTNGYPIFMDMINGITPGNVFAEQQENIISHIAMAHTTFNVANVLLLLPFVKVIAYICKLIVPIRKDDIVTTVTLEPHLLETPSIAIQQATRFIYEMTNESWKMLEESVKIFHAQDFTKEEELRMIEDKIDKDQVEVTDYLTRLTEMAISEDQATAIPLLMHCTNNAERMGDNAEDIIDLAKRLKKKHHFSKAQKDEVDQLFAILAKKMEIINSTIETDGNSITLKDTVKMDVEFKNLVKRFEKADIRQLRNNESDDAVSSVVFIELLNILGKINSRLTNIWERIYTLSSENLIETID